MKNDKSHLFFVELVGLAGAGKSTLAGSLVDQVEQLEAILPPDLHAINKAPFFIWNTLVMLPTFFAILRETNWKLLSRKEFAIMVILNGWADQLDAQSRRKQRAVLVDQGPISFFAMLDRLNSAWRQSPTGSKWLQKMFDRWSKVIDLIIVLDASNEVLVDRIRTRSQVHSLQQATFEEASEVLGLYREIYPRVIASLQSNNPCVQILSYITTSAPKEEFHKEVACDLQREVTFASDGG